MLAVKGSVWRRAVCREGAKVLRARPAGRGLAGVNEEGRVVMTGPVMRASAQTGLVAGMFGSIVGVGGGVIMVPMMTCEPMCLQARHASATSLVAVVGTGLVSAILYGAQGQVDVVGAGLLATSAMLTAPFGAKATMKINNNRLKAIMGMFLMVVAPAVPLKDMLLEQSNAKHDQKEKEKAAAAADQAGASAPTSSQVVPLTPFERVVAELKKCPGFFSLENDTERAKYSASLLTTGTAAGFASGLLGIGGGMIVTPVLALTSGMDQTSCVGTSMVAMVFPSVVSLYTHHTLGNVRWGVGRLLLLGSATGAFAGVQIANVVGDSGMKYIFAFGMSFLGMKTLKAAWAAPK